MQVPRIDQDHAQHGRGRGDVADKKILENAVADMTKIAGQKPVITKSRKSIAGFKIRDGLPDRLHGDAAPASACTSSSTAWSRSRCRACATSAACPAEGFDGRGNYNMGVKEQIIFPEIEYDKIDALRGMNISITTTAKTDAEARALLAAFKFPFRTERTHMSKLALINRRTKRAKLVEEVRRSAAKALFAIIANPKASDEDRFAARAQAAGAAAQRDPDAPAQPLRADGPPARRVPQVRPRPQQAARVRDARRDSRHRQGELVSEVQS